MYTLYYKLYILDIYNKFINNNFITVNYFM